MVRTNDRFTRTTGLAGTNQQTGVARHTMPAHPFTPPRNVMFDGDDDEFIDDDEDEEPGDGDDDDYVEPEEELIPGPSERGAQGQAGPSRAQDPPLPRRTRVTDWNSGQGRGGGLRRPELLSPPLIARNGPENAIQVDSDDDLAADVLGYAPRTPPRVLADGRNEQRLGRGHDDAGDGSLPPPFRQFMDRQAARDERPAQERRDEAMAIAMQRREEAAAQRERERQQQRQRGGIPDFAAQRHGQRLSEAAGGGQRFGLDAIMGMLGAAQPGEQGLRGFDFGLGFHRFGLAALMGGGMLAFGGGANGAGGPSVEDAWKGIDFVPRPKSKVRPGFTFDFDMEAEAENDIIGIDLDEDEQDGLKSAGGSADGKASLVCARCMAVLRVSQGQKSLEDRVHSLSCGHLLDRRCLDALIAPPPEPIMVEGAEIIGEQPEEQTSPTFHQVFDGIEIDSRQAQHVSFDTHSFEPPTPVPRTTRSQARKISGDFSGPPPPTGMKRKAPPTLTRPQPIKKARMTGRKKPREFIWYCPVAGCAQANTSKEVGGAWLPNKGSSMQLFV